MNEAIKIVSEIVANNHSWFLETPSDPKEKLPIACDCIMAQRILIALYEASAKEIKQ